MRIGGFGDSGEGKRLKEFFDHCAGLKNGLSRAHWDSGEIDRLMLRCSKRAFGLDPDGKQSLKNITDLADDMLQLGEFSEARRLFEKAVALAERDCFSIWGIGKCIERGSGRVTVESARYFVRSAALEGTANVANQVISKLLRFAGDKEQLVTAFLDDFEEHPETVSLQLIRALITSSIDRVSGAPSRRNLSSHLLDRIIEFEREYPSREAIIMVAMVLQRDGKNHQARAYFEKLGDLESLPDFVLVSYAACLRRL
jgi:tetratricopeptide (TPR) repeat protein